MAGRGQRPRVAPRPREDGEAVELAALVGADLVDRALGVAAAAGHLGDGDLTAITDHLACGGADAAAVPVDETHSAQPGTSAWEGFGR